jgi:hypothetical protein
VQPNYGSTIAGETPYSYGGGKLGVYCNDAFVEDSGSLAWTEGAESYLCTFNGDIGELFDNYFQGNSTLQNAYSLAYQAWEAYLNADLGRPACSACTTPAPGSYDVRVPPPSNNPNGYTCSSTFCPAGD